MNKKYFIAIIPPSPIINEIEDMKKKIVLLHNTKGALRSPAHITLHRPFEWKEKNEEILINQLSQFKSEKPFLIPLKNFGFFEPRVVFINVPNSKGLTELYTELKHFCQKKLKLLNEVNDLRGFHPHITIAFRDLKKPLFYELKKEFESKEYNNSFNYSGFSLLKFEKTWEVMHNFLI
ncbi:MAG: RNA 2',3'-cyclic phosphodiesterase [Bacteroidota bacterium]|nr:RNA 2',3'-cyclic phosphodiesterase [Bacteroidota bacterium]